MTTENTAVCKVCKGSGQIVIDRGDLGIVIEVCKKCWIAPQNCDIGHILITFNAANCPLCEALTRIAFLNEDLKRWRGTSKSTVQLMTERAQQAENLTNLENAYNKANEVFTGGGNPAERNLAKTIMDLCDFAMKLLKHQEAKLG